jgi:hypothetical protein
MDLDLENILEINEIRKLISHKKNLLIFFDELIKVKNINLQDNESFYSDTDSDYSYDSSNLSE